MEKNETKESDLVTKKLTRQLDFTSKLISSPTTMSVSPDQSTYPRMGGEQLQLQSELHLHLQTLQHVQVPAVIRIPSPVLKIPPPTMQLAQHEPPASQAKPSIGTKTGPPKKPKQCNCKSSRCLQLYCACFAAGVHCTSCNCLNCHNNVENEATRQDAVGPTLEHNPNAFKPKIAAGPHRSQDASEDTREDEMVGKHNRGCNCKKSGCLKKYCQCFQANVFCFENCKCTDCKNSEERSAPIKSPNGSNTVSNMQPAATAAINGTIVSSACVSNPVSKKRKCEENLVQMSKTQSVQTVGAFQQENHQSNSAAPSFISSIPISSKVNGTALGLSNLTYRSMMTDMLCTQDAKRMCTWLVILSEQMAKALAERKRVMERHPGDKNTKASLLAEERQDTQQKQPQDVQEMLPDEHVKRISGNKAEREGIDNYVANGNEIETPRPLKPPKIDFLCHEKETTFMEPSSLIGATGLHQSTTQTSDANSHDVSDNFAEQEKLILTNFHNFLNKIITCGRIRESMYSQTAISKLITQQESADRRDIKAEAVNKNLAKPYVNVTPESPVGSKSTGSIDLIRRVS